MGLNFCPRCGYRFRPYIHHGPPRGRGGLRVGCRPGQARVPQAIEANAAQHPGMMLWMNQVPLRAAVPPNVVASVAASPKVAASEAAPPKVVASVAAPPKVSASEAAS
ncbi:uncharacterized protein LOC131681842 [Topomyia yanbarensis]|uniref:uncharacterized protein LOC131681842 n=1 Tax=Topomyia yanbarensis TaxID=2498891 RepID=UPI00273AA90B|nr:uncharacterized protein LOC131681842 [Topomyia yanbarensis]